MIARFFWWLRAPMRMWGFDLCALGWHQWTKGSPWQEISGRYPYAVWACHECGPSPGGWREFWYPHHRFVKEAPRYIVVYLSEGVLIERQVIRPNKRVVE